MKFHIPVSALLICLFVSVSCVAEKAPPPDIDKPSNVPMVNREDTDDVYEPDEYRAISVDGSLTRRPCPYTCEMRGIPKEHCKTWKSQLGDGCYVQDLRGHNGAVPIGQ